MSFDAEAPVVNIEDGSQPDGSQSSGPHGQPTGQPQPGQPGQLGPRSDEGAEEGLVACNFECGPPQPMRLMYRSNPHAAWQCRPCYNAARALTGLAKHTHTHTHTPESQASLAKLIEQDEKAWHSMVRSCRAIGTGKAEQERRRQLIHSKDS